MNAEPPLSRLFSRPQQVELSRMNVVDFARGIAALAVLFYHYQFLYYFTPGIRNLRPEESVTQPHYDLLWLFYDYGYCAVNFFWMLSGFVFSAVYITKFTTIRSFFVNRFARLYPLHLVTLCVVAILQAVSWKSTGQFQIIVINDAYHFVLNLLIASFWGLQKGPSFNAPIWSVSVEVLVYGLFWVTLPFLYRKGVLGPIFLATLGWVAAFLLPGHLPLLRQCVFYFFSGTVIYLVFDHLRLRPAIIFIISGSLLIVGVAVLVASPEKLLSIAIPCFLAALLFVCCGFEGLSLGDKMERFKWFGDATYGMYLWHVPLLITILMIFHFNPGARAVITETWFLIGYLLSVVTIARISFVYIERPARERLRRFAFANQQKTKAEGLDEMVAP